MKKRSSNSRSESQQSPPQRSLLIIGGNEDKEGDCVILRELVRELNGGKLVVATVASVEPEEQYARYDKLFRELGVKELAKLEIKSRGEAQNPEMAAVLEGAAGVFFTGGDQLRITSQLGDTPVLDAIYSIFEDGGLIAGTSAGASVMSDTMLVSGESRGSYRISDSLRMAPGLGLLPHVIIDQHFSERGRFGRLLGAVGHNPQSLGLGIDEDTAILVRNFSTFTVIGSGAVYVLDGRGSSYSNIADATADSVMSISDVTMHALCHADQFNLQTRRPGSGS